MTCRCVRCSLCGGSGSMVVGLGGRVIGQHMTDDTDDLEMCEECYGSGIAEECDCCRDAREEDEAHV